MASIEKHRNGWRVQVYLPNGSRKRLYIGTVTKATATYFAKRLDELVAVHRLGAPMPSELKAWVGRLAPSIMEGLAGFGLIERPATSPILGPFLEGYIAGRVDVKPLTIKWLKRAAKLLTDHYGAGRKIATITAGDAQRFAAELRANRAASTVGREIKRFRQFWSAAEADGLVLSNPWMGISATMEAKQDRRGYVDAAIVRQVIDRVACPEARLVIALARWCGLRIPSEPLELTWNDVDWELGRMVIRSPKNARHASGVRTVPIFPEVRPYLEALWDSAGESPMVFRIGRKSAGTRYRAITVKAIESLGLEPWPKLFVNLRASCRTDLERVHPNHVCNVWLGHSGEVAEKYYLTVTEEDWAKAR